MLFPETGHPEAFQMRYSVYPAYLQFLSWNSKYFLPVPAGDPAPHMLQKLHCCRKIIFHQLFDIIHRIGSCSTRSKSALSIPPYGISSRKQVLPELHHYMPGAFELYACPASIIDRICGSICCLFFARSSSIVFFSQAFFL